MRLHLRIPIQITHFERHPHYPLRTIELQRTFGFRSHRTVDQLCQPPARRLDDGDLGGLVQRQPHERRGRQLLDGGTSDVIQKLGDAGQAVQLQHLNGRLEFVKQVFKGGLHCRWKEGHQLLDGAARAGVQKLGDAGQAVQLQHLEVN